MADDRAKELLARWRANLGARSTWNSHWEDLARVLQPRRLGFVTNPIPGEKRTENLYDGTPMQAARSLANAIAGLLRPDGQTWVQIKTTDDALMNSDEVKDWCANAQDALFKALLNPKARFRQATGETDLDLVVFGTGVLYAGENTKQMGQLLHQSVHLKDAVVIFSEEGDPEGIFICHRYSLRQAVSKFTKEKLSEALRRLLDEAQPKLDEKYEFLHVVLPREEGNKHALLSKNLPYADIWIEVQQAHEIKVSGFHEFPFIVPRFDTSSGEDYGRSPGMIALPDSNTLQAMGETLLVAGQRAADPPLLVPNDGATDPLNTFPGGLAYYDVELAKEIGRIPVEIMKTGENIPLTREMQMDMREQVWAAFFRNILNLPVDGPQMTAEEIRARKEEIIREVGPAFGRLETDYTAPTVERDFKILLRTGQLPPVPEALAGKSVRFEYESPVKRIKQQIEAIALRSWVADHVEIAKATGREDVLDPINLDEYSKFTASANGIPHQVLNGTDKVAEIRAQRAQQQQAEAEAIQTQQMADAANKGASAVKQLQPEAA